MPARPRPPARAAGLLLLLAGLALPLGATVHSRLAGPTLHGAVVGLSGPVIVTQEAARRGDALPGRPIDGRPLGGSEDVDDAVPLARRLVSRGALDAAVVVDLRRSTDTLLVPDWTPDGAAAELAAVTGAVSASYGRAVRTERVAPPRPVDRRLPALLAAALVACGVLLAAAISAWRGPIAATPARSVARLAGTAASGLVVGTVAATLATSLTAPLGGAAAAGLALVGAATVTVSAWLVLAAEAVLDLVGLALATALLLGPVAPLLGGADPAYLPSPWWQLDATAPQQAALRLLTHEAFGVEVAEARAWLVIGAWAAISVLTLAVARRARPARTA